MDTPIDCETPGLAPEVRAALCDRLITSVAHRLGYRFSMDARPDVYDQVRKSLVSAARTWNPERSKFVTHATAAIKYALKYGGERRGKGQTDADRLWQEGRTARLRADPRAEVDGGDEKDYVRAGLDGLPEADRAVLLSWLEHGQNASAAGRTVGVGRETMRKRVGRALERLKHLIGGDDAEPK